MKVFSNRIPVRSACKGVYLRWWYNGWHYWFWLVGNISLMAEGEKYRTIGTTKLYLSSGQITLPEAMAIKTILNTREISIWTAWGWKSLRLEHSPVPVWNNFIPGEEIEIVALIGSKELSYIGMTAGYSPITEPPEPPNLYQGYGALYNWPVVNGYTTPPAYDFYDGYGALYNWFAATDAHGFAPAGWHVPTKAEFVTLETELGGNTVAGGKLKETGIVHFDPNIGASNSSGFTAYGSGTRVGDTGVFGDLKLNCYLLSVTLATIPIRYWFLQIYGDSDNSNTTQILLKNQASAIRLIKDDSIDPGYLFDYDSNLYPTVKIGTQVWTAANWACTHYTDGTPITNVTDDAAWAALATEAYCWYNNTPS